MIGNTVSSFAEKTSKYLPTLTVCAFAFAFIHEVGLSWGLRFNILRFYSPSDFLSVALQFLWVALLPFLQAILAPLYHPLPYIGEISRRAQLILIAIALFYTIALISLYYTGILNEYILQAGIFIGMITTGLIAASMNKTLHDAGPAVSVFFAAISVVFNHGAMEGIDFRSNPDKFAVKVSLAGDAIKEGDFALVRLLANGAIVIGPEGEIIYTKSERLASAVYSPKN